MCPNVCIFRNIVVGFVTVYKCLIFSSIYFGSSACIMCRCAPSPNTDYNRTFLVQFATLCTQISGRRPYLRHDWFFPNIFQPIIQYYLNICHFKTYSKLLPASSHKTICWWNSELSYNSSNWDSRITRQLGYKHTFCQNVVSKKKLLVHTFS